LALIVTMNSLKFFKSIQQNARLAAFNVDPLFNNSVDGLCSTLKLPTYQKVP